MARRARQVRPYDQQDERVQLLVRIPAKLHRSLKHVAVDRRTSMNEMLLQALVEWWSKQPERGRYPK